MTVNLSLLGGAGWQFSDNNGVPLSGGLLYTYAAGTTTPQTTYTSISGVTANTNPVVLDSAGRVPSEIWLTDAVSYKFVLETSASVTIGTYDNVTGNSSGIYAAFAAPTGSSLVGFIQSGTGAVATTVQAKLRESVSVTDFGAVGNGVADDTAAIQATHDYSIANGFPHVIFPTGTYRFTTLTWSPHVGARTTGKVYLQTAIASGRAIQVSDEYGLPLPYGVNSIRNLVWSGQFFLINTNGSNTATAWAFGGATVANYCGWCTVLSNVETRGFHGKVYEFRYNCALIDFQQCFAEGNNASHVYAGSSTFNSGEGVRFFGCIFGSGTGYLVDITNVAIWSIDFIACSCDYLLGMNKPGNSAPLTAVNWIGGHIEWSEVTYPYLQNDAAMTWNIDGALVAPVASSGWPTPVVSKTTRISPTVNGTTRFTNIKYVIPGTTPILHQIVDATSRGVFDYTPNYQNGNIPPLFVSSALGSTVGFDGITYQQQVGDSSVIWSGTIGNGSKTYTWTRIGNRVDVWLQIIWGSTTSHPASQQTVSLPFAANSLAGGFGSGWINDSGTGNRLVVGRVTASATAIVFYDIATDAILSNVIPITWAVGDILECHVTYFTETP